MKFQKQSSKVTKIETKTEYNPTTLYVRNADVMKRLWFSLSMTSEEMKINGNIWRHAKTSVP